jgi:alpha-soluble NSF attachment protein
MADFVKQAESKLKPGFLGGLFGGPKYEEASDLYVQAANQFKLAKEWDKAADAFAQCAYCANKSGSQTDEANFYEQGGHILKKVSTVRAVEQYEKAIAIQSASGRFPNAGKLLVQIAELYEGDSLQSSQIKEYYKRAADMFELDEHSKSNLTKCNLKYAEYAAKDGDLQDAIKIFETEGEKALGNNLLQYGAKEHFLKAGILHLAQGDSVSVNIAVDKYKTLDPKFASSREGELMSNLAVAFESGDVEMYEEKLYDFDSVTKLDAWKTDFLLKAKDTMTGGAGSLEGGAVDLT